MIVNQGALAGINKGFKTIFNKSLEAETSSNWSKVATLVTSETSEENYKWLGTLPSVREWIGGRHIQNLSVNEYTIKNRNFEATIAVDRNDIEDDRLSIYRPAVESLAHSVQYFPDDIVFEVLENGFSKTCFDGKAFFGTRTVGKVEMNNKTDKKLTIESYADARATMMSFKDEKGKSLNIIPNLLIVPPALEGMARQILTAENINGTTNIYKGTAEILVVPQLKSETSWYLLCTTKSVKPIIFQERKKPNFVALDSENDENVFNRREFIYGVELRANAGYGFWQTAFGSTGTATK